MIPGVDHRLVCIDHQDIMQALRYGMDKHGFTVIRIDRHRIASPGRGVVIRPDLPGKTLGHIA